jgi:hypothetical protein
MINDKDGHIPMPLIMFTCTALRNPLLEWQKNKGVHPKASKSKLKANRPDRSNDFNRKNVGGKIRSYCNVTGRKLSTSPGVADTDTFLMNTWNTPTESYQQSVYNKTLATVNHQIQQADNPTPAVTISSETVCIEDPILHDYLTSEVAIEEREIRSTEANSPIDNNGTNDELHFEIPWGIGDVEDEGDESDAIPSASCRRRAATELERFDLRTSDLEGYEGEEGDDADEEEDASQADDGSTQNVQD